MFTTRGFVAKAAAVAITGSLGLAGCGGSSHPQKHAAKQPTTTTAPNTGTQAVLTRLRDACNTLKQTGASLPSTCQKLLSGGNSTTTTPATTQTQTTPSGPPACSGPVFQTASTCVLNGGTTVKIARGTATLHLKTLDAQVVGIRTASTVANSGISATANGVFLIIAIKVTNKASAPETFDGGGFSQQTSLELNGSTYTEDFHAENEADPQSFVTNNSPVQPGESVTGDLVYDVPPSKASTATSSPRAVLLIGNFGDDFSQSAPSTVGLIALKGA